MRGGYGAGMGRWPDGFQITATTWAGMLARAADRDPGCEVVFPTERTTLAALEDRAYALARRLIDAGVEAGDKVGIFLPPKIDYLAGLFAVSLAGAVCVPISTRFKTTELTYALERADARVVITSSESGGWGNLADALDPVLRQLPGLTAVFEGGDSTSTRADVVQCAVQVRVADPAFILYTSGTSANPKGCVITHESITRQAQSLAEINLRMGSQDCLVSPLPLFHIAGLAIYAAALHAGAKYCHSSFMEPAAAAEQLHREGVTVWQPAFDTIFAPIIDLPSFNQETTGTLRVMICAGTAGLLRRVQERIPWASVMANYGSTEGVGSVLMPYPDDPEEVRTDSAGHVFPGVQIRIADPETGREAPPGTRGEIQLRGPQIFSGYYRDDEANAIAFLDGGWFRTGDLATIDHAGRLRFDGRLKDMMKVGGENVAAVEVEAYLIGHPAIQVVSVVGAPDEKYGEVPVAFVELVPGATLSEQELIDFCSGQIASYKVPRHVRLVTEWPMSGTKIQKYVLRDRIAAELRTCG
jgi:fatty-acyl-CoA synthase